MTHLQVLRAQALLVDLVIEERHHRGRRDREAAAAVERDRMRLADAVSRAAGEPPSLRELVHDGIEDRVLELLLDLLERRPLAGSLDHGMARQ